MKMMPIQKTERLAINGILLLNKSDGMTSNVALQRAKRIFSARKAGHTGSLDPLATGMLPICFGEATKVCQYLLESDKCYQTTGLLGQKTNTADATGDIIACQEHFDISTNQLTAVLEQYQGRIQQVPSMFSALKHQGQPLYRLAREGITIERKAREVHITHLTLDSFDGRFFSLTVACSKGTYIRNLVEDIGDSLAVGAHVTRLHRLYTSGFQDEPMYSLDELQEMSDAQRLACLLPIDKAIDYLEPIYLSHDELVLIRQGQQIEADASIEPGTCIRLYDEQQQFAGLGQISANRMIKAKRLLSF